GRRVCLVRPDDDGLISALRARRRRPDRRVRAGRVRVLWQRADIVEQRVLAAELARESDRLVDLVLGRGRAEILPRRLEVAVEEAVPCTARNAGRGDRKSTRLNSSHT